MGHLIWKKGRNKFRKEQRIFKLRNREGFQIFHLQLKCCVRLRKKDCSHLNDLLFNIQHLKKTKQIGCSLVQTFYKGKFPFVALVKVELHWPWEESHVAAGLVKVQFLCGWRNSLFLQGEEKKGSISSASESSVWPNRVMFTADVTEASTIWARSLDADGNMTVTGNVQHVWLFQPRKWWGYFKGELQELRYDCWRWPLSRLTAIQNPAELGRKHSREHAQIRTDQSLDVKFTSISAKGGDVTSSVHEQDT